MHAVMPPQLVDGCATRMDAYQACHAIVEETLVQARCLACMTPWTTQDMWPKFRCRV